MKSIISFKQSFGVKHFYFMMLPIRNWWCCASRIRIVLSEKTPWTIRTTLQFLQLGNSSLLKIHQNIFHLTNNYFTKNYIHIYICPGSFALSSFFQHWFMILTSSRCFLISTLYVSANTIHINICHWITGFIGKMI